MSHFQVTVLSSNGERYAVIRTIKRHGADQPANQSLFHGADRQVRLLN